MNTCDKCGGELIGDGYTSVIHCEYADESKYEYAEPDAGPMLCDFTEADTESTKYEGSK